MTLVLRVQWSLGSSKLLNVMRLFLLGCDIGRAIWVIHFPTSWGAIWSPSNHKIITFPPRFGWSILHTVTIANNHTPELSPWCTKKPSLLKSRNAVLEARCGGDNAAINGPIHFYNIFWTTRFFVPNGFPELNMNLRFKKSLPSNFKSWEIQLGEMSGDQTLLNSQVWLGSIIVYTQQICKVNCSLLQWTDQKNAHPKYPDPSRLAIF